MTDASTIGLVKKATLTATAAARARVAGGDQNGGAAELVKRRFSGNGGAAETTKPPRQAGGGRDNLRNSANLRKPAAKRKFSASKPQAKPKGPAQVYKPSVAKLQYNARNKRHWHSRLLLNKLREKYPLAFPAAQQPPRPLQVGIFEEMAAVRHELELRDPRQSPVPEFASKNLIAGFLAFYVRRWSYVRAIAAGGFRYDLQGNQVAQISEREQQHAIERLLQKASEAAETVTEKPNEEIPHKAETAASV